MMQINTKLLISRNRLSSDAKSAASEGAWSSRSPRSSEEGRLRWGDRGVATGRLWEPTAPNARLPQVILANGTKLTASVFTEINFRILYCVPSDGTISFEI